MLSSLTLAVALVLLAAPGIEPGTQLTYGGTMSGVKDDGNPAAKEFTLTLAAIGGQEDAVEFAWTLEETGRGGWTWLDRFGKWTVAGQRRDPGETGPALRYERAAGKSIVPLVPPLFAAPAGAPALAKDAAWTEDRLEYRVLGQAMKADRPCWEIEARSPYGHKRTLWIDKDSPLVLKVVETVFIGQGEEHKLQLDLADAKMLSPAETTKTAAALDAWLDLRTSLAWQPRSRREELSAEQLATLKAALPKMAETASAGPLAAIAATAKQDAAGQKNRAGAVAALREAIVGQSLGDLALSDLAGKPLAPELKGKIVVLHFWPYRDTPLEEPYGQVGYLDFLLRRRGAKDIRAIGVTVAEPADEERSPRAVAASARKLQAFMNLSYPIAVDDGALLRKVGDPRVAGGKLPLFVVIGRDGKVAEYHAGLYDVKANEGLAELDAVVEKLLK